MNKSRSHPSRKRLLLALAAAVGALLPLLVLALGEVRDARAPGTRLDVAHPAPLSVDAAAAPRPAGLALLAGDVLCYRFSSERRVRMETTNPQGLPGREVRLPTIETGLDLGARLTMRVYDRTPTGWTVGFRVSDVVVNVSSNQAAQPGNSGNLGEQMAGDVVASLTTTGTLEKIVFPKAMTPVARNAWKYLLTCWRVTLPADPDDESWEAQERDTTGLYLARYERLTRPGELPIEIARRKVDYLELRPQGEIALQGASRAEGRARYLFDPLLALAEGEDLVELSIEATGQRVLAQGRFRCVRISHEREPIPMARADEWTARVSRQDGTHLGEMEASRFRIHPQVARRRCLEACGSLRQLAAAGRRGSDAWQRTRYELERLIEGSDAAAEMVMDELAAASCPDTVAAALISALGGAGTPAAQEGLRTILADRLQPRRRVGAALYALASLREPMPELDHALLDLRAERPELATGALLLLGVVGHKVKDDDPARFERIQRYVERTLNQSRDKRELTDALEALGNLGPKEIPTGVRRALRSDHPLVRESALRAVRRTPGREADSLLAKAALNDPDADVRRAAVDLLSRRNQEGLLAGSGLPLPLDQLLDRIAAEDESKKVRDCAARECKRLRALQTAA